MDESSPCPLTDRQIEVVRLLADGVTQAEIAQRLYLGLTTVKTHLAHAHQRAGTRSAAHLVATALRRGWIR